MEATSQGTRECPYCKETIRDDAVRCRHCQAAVAPARPAHGGTCPYCKETIKPDAVRCKHCQSNLRADAGHFIRSFQPTSPVTFGRHGQGMALPGPMMRRVGGGGPPADLYLCIDGIMRCLDYCIIYADGNQICAYFDCGSCIG
jgi:hypothetical protein